LIESSLLNLNQLQIYWWSHVKALLIAGCNIPLIMNKIVLFGASGDLAKRKILPAIAKIYTDDIQIYGYARSDLAKDYSQEIRKFHDYSASDKTSDFPEKITYIQGDYTDLTPLKGILDKQTIVYLSLPPHVYQQVLLALSAFEVGTIAIEKPFGSDFESFKELAKLKRSQVHFIDHYLLKPLIDTIQDIYKKKPWLFEFLNRDNIQSAECVFLEKILAEGRDYFDRFGMVRDVMQNHLVEVLASVISDYTSGAPNESRYMTVKDISIEKEKYIFGQYDLYTKERKAESKTETFAAFKCRVNNDKWRGVPFFMAAGKGLSVKATEIRFNIKREQFGQVSDMIKNRKDADEYMQMASTADSVVLVFNAAPDGEIYLRITMKEGVKRIVLCGAEEVNSLSLSHSEGKEDYVELLSLMVSGEAFPSISFEEAGELWRIFTDVIVAEKELVYYKVGVDMPEEASEFFRSESPY